MNKFFKITFFFSIIIVFVYALSVFFSVDEKANPVIKTIVKNIKKEKPRFKIEYFSNKKTKDVSFKLDSLLKRIHKKHDFHGAVLVAKNDKIVYKNQVGFADFKKKTPLNNSSAFQLASVSKQFTAAAIMLLNEQKKIKLTDSVTCYFPDFPYQDVTIKNLLNHTAGLPKYFWVAEHKWQEKQAPTNSEMMDLLATTKTQRFFKPGRNFDYSNTGYFVLASIVEKISGFSFSTFMKKNIFEPLDMNNSYVFNSKNRSDNENQLVGYRLYRGWRHLKIGTTVNDAIVGDKNVYSTIEDLFKWSSGLNSGKLLKKESLDLMYSKGKTIYGRSIPYGLGFRIDREDKNKIYHYGKWNGFSSALTNYLEDDLTVIVLEHTSYNSMKSLNRKIKAIVSENFVL